MYIYRRSPPQIQIPDRLTSEVIHGRETVDCFARCVTAQASGKSFREKEEIVRVVHDNKLHVAVEKFISSPHLYKIEFE